MPIINLENAPTDIPVGQSSGDIFSTKASSYQMTLASVKLTKKKKNKTTTTNNNKTNKQSSKPEYFHHLILCGHKKPQHIVGPYE